MTGAELEKITSAIKKSPRSKSMPIKVVAIDGHGGAGKSTIAGRLAKLLEAEIIRIDDFATWNNPLNWWPRFSKDILEPIKQGAQTLSYERSSWGQDHKPDPVRDQTVTPIMILEGARSARREFRPYLSYAIWVETPRDICLERGIKRDGEAMRAQWEKWLAGEDKYIKRDNPRAYTDITVSGA